MIRSRLSSDISQNASSEAGETRMRPDGRKVDELRPIRFVNNIAPHATGSTLIEWGQHARHLRGDD